MSSAKIDIIYMLNYVNILSVQRNFIDTITINDTYPAGPSEDFFLHQMLGLEKETYNWDNFGIPKWDLVLCLLAAWILVCLCLIKGVKSSGKVKEILTFKYKMIKILTIKIIGFLS